MKELKISVIYGGSCPPQADPSMYNPDNYQANLQYFHDFLQRRGSSANTIDSYLTSVRHFHSLYRDVTVENLQSYKAWLMERYKPSTVNTRIYGINQYVAALQSGRDTSDTGPYTPAASMIRLCFRLSTASSGAPLFRFFRYLTSTNTRYPRWRATRSISPFLVRKFRSRIS